MAKYRDPNELWARGFFGLMGTPLGQLAQASPAELTRVPASGSGYGGPSYGSGAAGVLAALLGNYGRPMAQQQQPMDPMERIRQAAYAEAEMPQDFIMDQEGPTVYGGPLNPLEDMLMGGSGTPTAYFPSQTELPPDRGPFSDPQGMAQTGIDLLNAQTARDVAQQRTQQNQMGLLSDYIGGESAFDQQSGQFVPRPQTPATQAFEGMMGLPQRSQVANSPMSEMGAVAAAERFQEAMQPSWSDTIGSVLDTGINSWFGGGAPNAREDVRAGYGLDRAMQAMPQNMTPQEQAALAAVLQRFLMGQADNPNTGDVDETLEGNKRARDLMLRNPQQYRRLSDLLSTPYSPY